MTQTSKQTELHRVCLSPLYVNILDKAAFWCFNTDTLSVFWLGSARKQLRRFISLYDQSLQIQRLTESDCEQVSGLLS